VANKGATKVAFSLAAVYPSVAPRRPAPENKVAPTSSRFRTISAELNPLPDLKDKYRLAKAAPASEVCSLDEPALGNVNETVETREASSVTTVSPDARVVTEEELPFLGDGDVVGTLRRN